MKPFPYNEYYREVAFIYVVYLDQLILVNYLINVVTLGVLWIWNKNRNPLGTVLGGAAVGCGLGVVVFFCIHSYVLYLILQGMAVIPAMVLCQRPKKRFWIQLVGCYVIYSVIGGVASGLMNYFPSDIGALGLMITALVIVVVIAVIYHKMQCQSKQFYQVQLCHRHKNEEGVMEEIHVEVTALADTGNLMRDPYNGSPVSVVSAELMEQLQISVETIRMIPATTVSHQHMLLQAASIHKMTICGEQEIRPAVVAFADNMIFEGKNYQMILHHDYSI